LNDKKKSNSHFTIDMGMLYTVSVKGKETAHEEFPERREENR
jgi:hypothetical protein